MRERSLANLGPQTSDRQTVTTDRPATDPVVNRNRQPIVDQTQPVSTRSRDLDFAPTNSSGMDDPSRSQSSGEGGGGALDPITATICLGLGGAAAARRRKKLRHTESSN